MPTIKNEEIEAVRTRADIAEIIGHFIPVSKKGKSYVALCPFHDDHSPSLSISPEKQIYKCFVCGEGGNVFTFVQKFQNISFPEAVKEVADLVGYPLSFDASSYEEPKDPKKEGYYKVLEETIRFSMYQLNTQDFQTEKEYLEKRGLTQKIRDYFEIGYLPTKDALYQFLHAKGYADEDMVATNIARTSSSGIHDVFSGRITFPIHDKDGHPIGFSARSLDPKAESKYINTNDTELFQKGEILYNYHRAKNAARKAGVIYVCEGVTDVIAFYLAGIENCVCTLGTACTEKQMQLLKGAAPKIVFCYDGDDAGQNATWKAGKLAQKYGCHIGIVENTTGKDPDEIIRDEGKEALQELLKHEQVWMEFVLSFLRKHTNFDNYQSRKEFAQRGQAEIALLTDEMDRRHFIEVLSELTGFQLEVQEPNKQPTTKKQQQRTVKIPNTTLQAEEQIITQMLSHPEAIQQFENEAGYLTNKLYNEIAMQILYTYRSEGKVEIAQLIDLAENDEMRRELSRLATSWMLELPYNEKAMIGAIRKVRISATMDKIDYYENQLKQPMSQSQRDETQSKYVEYLQELRRYINEENNQE